MRQWNEGYVSDVPYLGGVYIEQMPVHLDTVCLMSGVAPAVEAGAPFNYCELGCGTGETAMVIAATYPQAKVWGFDFNPTHIVQGRAGAHDAGLDNLVLEERSFEELAQASAEELPLFDYITAHGVWSWVSLANQTSIVTFLRRFLRPGGVFSVSYNAQPGWSSAVPLQHLLMQASRHFSGGSDTRIREGIALARRVVDSGQSRIDPEKVGLIESVLKNGQARYLSHEYLNEDWCPAFHADVVEALAPAKLGYVCSANVLENFPAVCMTAKQHELLQSFPASMQQTLQDYFCPRDFRRDIFTRGGRALSRRDWQSRLEAQRLTLVVPEAAATCRIKVPIGEATLNPAFYEPAMDRLRSGPATVRELLKAAPPGCAPATREIAAMLIGSLQAVRLYATPEPAALARARRFNRSRIVASINETQASCRLASPLLGSAISTDVVGMLTYEVVSAAAEGEAPSPAAIRSGVLDLMRTLDMSFDARPGDAPGGADIAGEIDSFVARTLPMWHRLGIV